MSQIVDNILNANNPVSDVFKADGGAINIIIANENYTNFDGANITVLQSTNGCAFTQVVQFVNTPIFLSVPQAIAQFPVIAGSKIKLSLNNATINTRIHALIYNN